MYYHSNQEEYQFFEVKRFSSENLPVYADVFFILKDFKILDNNQFEKIHHVLNRRITPEIWKRIKQVAYFDEASFPDLQDLRKNVFEKDPNYKRLIAERKIFPFEEFEYDKGRTLKEALKDVDVSTYSSMYEYFARGENVGTCGFSSKLIGVMFDRRNVICQSGTIKAFTGTPKSEKGKHAWIVVRHNGKDYIVDTSLCLMIPTEYAKELGYVPEKNYHISLAIEENSDEGDMLYSHYSFQNFKTKNKASYDLYRRNRELFRKKQNKIQIETEDIEI